MAVDIPDTSQWQVIHETLVGLAGDRARLDSREAIWLVAGWRAKVHKRLGMGSYREYLERLFGYGPREAAERLRVARAVDESPALGAALESGSLRWSAVRELARIARPATASEWVEAATGKTVREIEKLVSGRRPGDRPSCPPSESARMHLLRFEVSAEAYALWREAVMMVRRELGGEVSEDDALLEIARRIVGGPRDPGRAGYQVMMRTCEACGKGEMVGRGEPIVVDDSVVSMARCDAQIFHAPSNVTAQAPEARGSFPSDLDGAAPASPGAEERTHMGHGVEDVPQVRAKQNVAPATRRFVHHDDHGQCAVDGCRAATYLDVHHLDLRSEGGGDDPERLTSLCVAHHRAAHQGRLLISGTRAGGFRFFHADGRPYGSPAVQVATADVFAAAATALRHFGLGESAVRRALDRLRPGPDHKGPPPTKEGLMGLALSGLTL
jgi:hypothetical protein